VFVFIGWQAHGTGSYPPGLNGWQRQILLKASLEPFAAPYLVMAS